MTPIEPRIREQLGVPQDAGRVLILGMDAHMDWDWLNTFQTLVEEGNQAPGQGSVLEIIRRAWQLMIDNPGPTAPYMYSVCEMGFLRAALENDPDLVTQFREHNLGRQLGIEGGGITSPDNLLPHGEAFLRNYLVGWAWQQATLGLPTTFAYLPDDFGHDAQLPVMLAALGFSGVSFSRMPGSQKSSRTAPRSGQSLYQDLMQEGADFFWQASDGSSVLAHLEQKTYCQGSQLPDDPSEVRSAKHLLTGYFESNKSSSPSPYIYIPCGCDFLLPNPYILDFASAWNADQKANSTGAWAAVGTLGQYLQMVLAWSGANPNVLISRPFDPTPYWTGFYASRPANKILHHATVRALLGAEVFGSIADSLQTADSLAWAPVKTARQQAVAQGWEALLPSTHHDYITGTAVDSVYTGEQLPLLQAAHAIAQGARITAVQEIATLIGASPAPGETPVAAFNQLGFARTGVVEITARPGLAARSVRARDNTTGPVQTTAEGNLLFAASAPSLGYQTYYLSDQPTGRGDTVAVQVSSTDGSVTMTNGQLQVVLTRDQGWAITSLRPIVGGQLQADLVPAGQSANALTFYKDRGNIYNFGNETNDPSGFQVVTGTLSGLSLRVLEQGPLRARVEAQVSFGDGTSSATYTLEYTLVAHEPLVRMAITGTAPLPADPSKGGTPYSVMVRFPFAGSGGGVAEVDGVLRGTPYHWHDQLPVPYWNGPTFQASHHFVVPSAGGVSLAALYHADLPAWAIDDHGAMIGCILRNTPSQGAWPATLEGRGANGADFGRHTHAYALRIPQGLVLPPSSSAIFRESSAFATPLLGASVNTPSDGVMTQAVQFPDSFSLAAVTGGDAILTAGKSGQFDPGALILRLYQPSNASQELTLDLSDYIQATRIASPQALPVTALEQAIPGAATLPVTNGSVALSMDRALATIAITPATAAAAVGDRRAGGGLGGGPHSSPDGA